MNPDLPGRGRTCSIGAMHNDSQSRRLFLGRTMRVADAVLAVRSIGRAADTPRLHLAPNAYSCHVFNTLVKSRTRKAHLVLEVAVESGTPKTLSPVEAHRWSAEYARRVLGPRHEPAIRILTRRRRSTGG